MAEFLVDLKGSRKPIATLIGVLLALPMAAYADIAAAPDVTIDLSGVPVSDHQVAIDDLNGGITLQTFLGSLDSGVEVDAYHDDLANGVLFSTDTRVALPAGVNAGDEDVVRLFGGSFSLVFDGSALGVPAGAGVDAVTRSGSHLILSFDTAVDLGGVVYADEDLVRFDGAVFSSALDLSAQGLDPALDTDAVAAGGPGVWVLSFDSDGALGSVDFADEDVVLVNTSGGPPTFSLLYDASSEHASWQSADLGALPEPSRFAAGICGAALLAALTSRRRK